MRASTRKTIWILVAAFLCVYVASYLAISRYSRAIAGKDGPPVFCVPGIARVQNDRALESTHLFLTCAYFPLWAAEHFVLGGPRYGSFPSTRLEHSRDSYRQ